VPKIAQKGTSLTNPVQGTQICWKLSDGQRVVENERLNIGRRKISLILTAL